MKKIVPILVILVTGLILTLSSIRVVKTGETGVRVRLGQVQDETLTPGVHFVIPFVDSVKKVNNKQTEFTYSGQVWCESAEQTPVYYENIAITYQIAPSASVWLYSNVDKNIINDSTSLIPGTMVSSAIKNASVTLTTKEVTKRASIEPLATKELQQSINEKYGEDVITIIKLSISNADFEDSYNAVIAERQSAQIRQEQQQIENQTAIAKAEADAEAARLKAQGEADALTIKAQGEAEATKIAAEAEANANQQLRESLTDEIITNNFLEKWNGELPKVQSGENGIMLDVDNLITETPTQ